MEERASTRWPSCARRNCRRIRSRVVCLCFAAGVERRSASWFMTGKGSVKTEKIPQLPSKAPFSKRFEEAVGLACESAAVRRVAQQFGLAGSTVRAIDLRYLERWAAARRKPALRQMGVDEIHLGKKQKFLTVVSNLETGEPLWFGRERKKETLDEFFEK